MTLVPWDVDCSAFTLTSSLHTCSLHVAIRASRKLVKCRNLHPEGIHRRTDNPLYIDHPPSLSIFKLFIFLGAYYLRELHAAAKFFNSNQ